MKSYHQDFYQLSILFAEKQESVREEIIYFLRNAFKVLYYTTDGRDAWQLYKKYRPDIVLTDIHMPGLDGIELIKNVREVDQNTPIVVLSSHKDEASLLKAVTLHLDEYLLKPIRRSELMEVMSRCASRLRKGGSFTARLNNEAYYCYSSKQVVHPDRRIALTDKEIKLLELLLDRRGSLIYYSEIEYTVWDGEVMSLDALKTMTKKIRKKIPKGMLKNIAGVGYTLE